MGLSEKIIRELYYHQNDVVINEYESLDNQIHFSYKNKDFIFLKRFFCVFWSQYVLKYKIENKYKKFTVVYPFSQDYYDHFSDEYIEKLWNFLQKKLFGLDFFTPDEKTN